jgi:hypothetical protein
MNKRTKTVKNILFEVKLAGVGLVNYDSNEQKKMFFGTNLQSKFYTPNNNQLLAKKCLSGDSENLTYKNKISAPAMRNAMFTNDIEIQSSAFVHIPELLLKYIANIAMIIRGFFIPNAGFKRSSIVTLTSAIQTNDAVSTMEWMTSSGVKKEKSENDLIPDTSVYIKEDIGDITYKSKGAINIRQAQLMVCDKLFDRYAFSPDLFPTFKIELQKHLKNFNSELVYVNQKNGVAGISEFGILFSNENIIEMVKSIFERLLNINITRANAYAQTTSVRYKLVYDVFEDRFDNEDGWITITKKSDLDLLDSVVFEEFYEVAPDPSIAILNRKIAEEETARIAKEKTEEKLAKKLAEQQRKLENAAKKKQGELNKINNHS